MYLFLAVVSTLGVLALGADNDAWLELRIGEDLLFKWRIDGDDIEFDVEASTRGWLAVGLSPNGGMAGSDVMLGWVDDDSGIARVIDASIGANPPPKSDAQQDVRSVSGEQNATHTRLSWRRALKTCDAEADRAVTSDTTRLIWAIGTADPSSVEETQYHARRGAQSIVLAESRSAEDIRTQREAMERDHDTTWRFYNDRVDLGTEDTLYWCSMFPVPESTGLKQIGGRTVVDPIENAPYVHHLIVYLCDDTVTEESLGDTKDFACYGSTGNRFRGNCRSDLWYGWAIGGPDEVLPIGVGAPRSSSYLKGRYVMLEMHYDNPQRRPGIIDSSGVEIFLTSKERENDAGFFYLTAADEWNIAVPPKQSEFTVVTECPSAATTEWFPAEGIHIEAVFAHTHLTGAKMRVRHVRDGEELAPVYRDEHYDFNYQGYRQVYPLVNVLRGDRLILECVYSTVGRENMTFGGLSTRREMCLAGIRYYPNVRLASCGHQPDA